MLRHQSLMRLVVSCAFAIAFVLLVPLRTKAWGILVTAAVGHVIKRWLSPNGKWPRCCATA